METLKLDQYQLDSLIRQLSIPSSFDTIQLIISVLTVVALIVTLMIQSQTAKDQLAAALLDRRAKKAEYMPFVDVKFSMYREHDQDDFGTFIPMEDKPFDFYLTVEVTKNTLTRPRFELESNISGFQKLPVTIDPNAYWGEGEKLNFTKVASIGPEYGTFYTSPEMNYAKCTFIFEDMLGNPYSVTAAIISENNGYRTAIEPVVSIN